MGKLVKRPHLPVSIIVIVSFLVGYVKLSLLYLGMRSAFSRTGTTTLSSLAMMFLTRDAAEKLPRLPVVLHEETGNEEKFIKGLAGELAVVGDVVSADKVGILAVGAKVIVGVPARRYRDADSGGLTIG